MRGVPADLKTAKRTMIVAFMRLARASWPERLKRADRYLILARYGQVILAAETARGRRYRDYAGWNEWAKIAHGRWIQAIRA